MQCCGLKARITLRDKGVPQEVRKVETPFSSPLLWNVLKYPVNNVDEFIAVIRKIEEHKA